jgi:hypothetical protein
LGRTSPAATFMDRRAGCVGGSEVGGSGRATTTARVRGRRPSHLRESDAGAIVFCVSLDNKPH